VQGQGFGIHAPFQSVPLLGQW